MFVQHIQDILANAFELVLDLRPVGLDEVQSRLRSLTLLLLFYARNYAP